jgi:acetolactate synthase-1/2/3 large subunit
VDRDLYAKLKTHEPVKALAEILQACPKDYWAFSDAGATLSWTYQAASICDSPPITTAFNLHAMGYALPAAVGAAVACDRPGILSISGDGGFLMNVQELAVAIGCQVPIKVVVIDNEGYGIIRQTQDTFLGGRYFGSDKGAFPSLPNYRIAEIIKGFGFEVLESGSENAADTARWLFEKQSGHRAVIIKVDPKTEVEGVAPKYAPLAF